MAKMTPRQKIAFAVALYQGGHTIVQACEEMGIHRNTLARHLRQLGVTPRKAPGSHQTDPDLRYADYADAAFSREVRMRQEWRALNRRMPPNVNGSPYISERVERQPLKREPGRRRLAYAE